MTKNLIFSFSFFNIGYCIFNIYETFLYLRVSRNFRTVQKERLIIKGTILTYGEKFFIGEDVFSSILFSVMNSWYYSYYTNAGILKSNNLTELKIREFGRIKSALNGYTEDLHNISINYGLLNEIKNNKKVIEAYLGEGA